MQRFKHWLKTRSISKPDVLNGLRTAAALCVGNSVVLPLLTSGPSQYWPQVMIGGIIVIIGTSVKGE
jgi:hypothetical protein